MKGLASPHELWGHLLKHPRQQRCAQVPDYWAQLSCEAWEHKCHRVARYAETSVKVSYTKASVPRDEVDDEPSVHNNRRVIEEGFGDSRVGESKPEDATTHEGNILYVTILQE